MLYVRTQVDGHKHKDVSLRYALYSRRTQTAFTVPLPHGLERVQRTHLEAPSQRSVQLLWMPDLSGEEDVFVRVSLMSEHGLLAVTDSPILHNGMIPH